MVDWLRVMEGALVLLMLLALIGVFYLRFRYERPMKKGDGIKKVGSSSRRTTQFLSVALLLPALTMLALEDRVGTEALGTLLGTFIGYVLSGIGEADDQTDTN